MPVTMQANIIWKVNLMPQMVAELPERVHKMMVSYAIEDLLPKAKDIQQPHIDTQALNDSGTVDDRGQTQVTVVFTGGALNRAGNPRVYAVYHEEGTTNTGAYPFMAPALVLTFEAGLRSRVDDLIPG